MSQRKKPWEIEFLTLLVPISGPISLAHISTIKRVEFVSGGHPTEYSVLSDTITVFCRAYIINPESVVHTPCNEPDINIRASGIANNINSNYIHHIIGNCAFVVEEDTLFNRAHLNQLMQNYSKK